MKFASIASLLVGAAGVLLTIQNFSELELIDKKVGELESANANINNKLEISRKRVDELEARLNKANTTKEVEMVNKKMVPLKEEISGNLDILSKEADNTLEAENKKVASIEVVTEELLEPESTVSITEETDGNKEYEQPKCSEVKECMLEVQKAIDEAKNRKLVFASGLDEVLYKLDNKEIAEQKNK